MKSKVFLMCIGTFIGLASADVIENIRSQNVVIESSIPVNNLNESRKQILVIDKQLIELMAQRQKLSLEIGQAKKELNMPVYDPVREEKLKIYHDKLAEESHLSPVMVNKVFEVIIEESRKVQK
jgi:chorismate mutase